MSTLNLQTDFALYLLAIKQAFEHGRYSDSASAQLSEMFQHGILFFHILENPSLCHPDILATIEQFCALVHVNLPPPQAELEVTFVLELDARGRIIGGSTLPNGLEAASRKLSNTVLVELITVLQVSILELSAELNTELSVSDEDVDGAKYVVGMAEITSANLEATVATETLSSRKAERFFADATRFAAALKDRGFGFVS